MQDKITVSCSCHKTKLAIVAGLSWELYMWI